MLNWISPACMAWPACTHSLYVYTTISMVGGRNLCCPLAIINAEIQTSDSIIRSSQAVSYLSTIFVQRCLNSLSEMKFNYNFTWCNLVLRSTNSIFVTSGVCCTTWRWTPALYNTSSGGGGGGGGVIFGIAYSPINRNDIWTSTRTFQQGSHTTVLAIGCLTSMFKVELVPRYGQKLTQVNSRL